MASPKIVFVTGASGFIGSAVVRQAVSQGYIVRGLSRSELSDDKIKKAGGVPVRGDLLASDVLSRESANADVICYFASAFSGDFSTPYEEAMKLTQSAVDCIGAAIEGTSKPLVIASSALITKADPDGGETTEDDPEDPNPFFDHASPSLHALAWAKRGVRVVVIRLAPDVYGPGEQLSGIARHFAAGLGGVPIVDGGGSKISSVHVDDAARLCLLAAERSAPGECYNCASDTNTTMGELLTEIGDALGTLTKKLTFEEAKTQIGPMFAVYLSISCRASSRKARELLGWQPKEVGVCEFYKDLKKTI